MDAKKKSPPAPAAAAGAASNGYFNSVFPASTANVKDAKQGDLYAMLNKQSSKGHNGGGTTDGKYQGSPTKGRAAYKDGKQYYPNESSEPPFFGSSLNYGARDFYDSSATHKQADESARNYKDDNSDGPLATRGDWWQGSLYY